MVLVANGVARELATKQEIPAEAHGSATEKRKEEKMTKTEAQPTHMLRDKPVSNSRIASHRQDRGPARPPAIETSRAT